MAIRVQVSQKAGNVWPSRAIINYLKTLRNWVRKIFIRRENTSTHRPHCREIPSFYLLISTQTRSVSQNCSL